MRDDDVRETPPAVVGAVAMGTAPLPFLAVYTVLFLIHGSVHPVNPPDVTSSTTGEFIAGWIALVAFVLTTMTLLWFLNSRRRWPFLIVQLAILGVAVDFLVDNTTGGRFISVLIVATSVLALILGIAPQSWRHVDRAAPAVLERAFRVFPGLGTRPAADQAGASPLAHSSTPTEVEPASLRRRRGDSTADSTH